jgi:hypothetical protein
MTATAATSSPAAVARLREIAGRPVPSSDRAPRRILVGGAIVAGVALIAASAVIHLHLWLIGYRHIHLIGPAFLGQVVSGFVIAALLLVSHRLIWVLAGVAFCAGSAVALILSATVGFLGLHDGLDVPWAAWSLGVELAGAVLLTACAATARWS